MIFRLQNLGFLQLGFEDLDSRNIKTSYQVIPKGKEKISLKGNGMDVKGY